MFDASWETRANWLEKVLLGGCILVVAIIVIILLWGFVAGALEAVRQSLPQYAVATG